MRSNMFGIVVLAAILLVGVVQFAYYYPQLPRTVAVGFDIHGNAGDERVSKTVFSIFDVGMILLPPVLVVLVRLDRRTPGRMGFPRRDYWFASHRKTQTEAMIFHYKLWSINAIAIFLTLLRELIYRANLGQPEAMRRPIWFVIGGFLSFVVVWVAAFFWRFAHPPR